MINEAIDKGPDGNLFHRSKEDLYSNKQEIEKMFPDLGPEAQRYLEMITGQAYQKAIERLQQYTGKQAKNLNVPGLFQLVMPAIQQVTQIQVKHKQQLEKLAVDIVLQMPEFEMFKGWVADGRLRIDAKLESANLDNAITETEKQAQQEQGTEQELTPSEQIDDNLGKSLQDASDNILKRKFSNMMTQGNAVNKLYLFQLANDSLQKIDPKLTNLYGILSSVVQATYYAMPHTQFDGSVKNAAVGSEEIDGDENGYIIRARSPFFPYLIHEIVKGCWDLLSIDIVSNEELGKETLDDEVIDIMSGPQLYINFAKLFSSKDMKYIPYVYRLLMSSKDINTIKEILSGGGKSQQLINNLILQVKEMLEQGEEGYKDSY